MLKVAKSSKKLHIISGLDLGTIEKNIINPDLGIIDIFGGLIDYRSSGNIDHKLPHIRYHMGEGKEDKIIYILGYDNKARWKKALGGQYGCLYVDEINIADMEYIREVSMRADYILATLNPDDPELPIYHEYINHSRPLPQYYKDAPIEINSQLTKEPKLGWVHWFFHFDHNAGLTEKKKRKIISTVPKGTKLYENKILGLRGRAEGLVFSAFEYQHNVITTEQAKKMKFTQFTCGVDTSYSQQTEDTIVFMYQGITDKGELVVLEEEILSNKDNNKPFSPSDVATRLITFMEVNRRKWGFSRYIHIDNADQGTITEVRKAISKRTLSYVVMNSDKTLKIIDRVNLMHGWINPEGQSPSYLVVNTCDVHIHEINSYSYVGDNPEDRNDHTINAGQYGWIPHKHKIGYEEKDDREENLSILKKLR